MAALRQEELLELAESAVNSALRKGADEAEAAVFQESTTSAGIERGQIVKTSRTLDLGLGMRTIISKAVGFAYTNVLSSRTAVENTVRKSLGLARASKPYKDWKSLPAGKIPSSPNNTYDKRIANLESEDLVEIASIMLDAAARTDGRANPVEGGANASCSFFVVANSNGVLGSDIGTIVGCSLATVGNDADDVTPVCFDFDFERTYAIDPERVGKEAVRLAVSALKAKTIETKTNQVIFTQTALQELLYFTLINAVRADSVQRNQSVFKGKIGDMVASEHVTIYDDGLLDGGLRSGKFDAEGVPHQKTLIIEKGVLRNFIYDNYTAKKEGRESTGNATRAGYFSTPTVEATNFRITGEERSPERLIEEVDDGLIVHLLQGAHSSNPASGDFSVVAAPAWKIEKGERTFAAKGVMLVGNVFQMLKNVSALANNERKLDLLVAPWVLVENVKLIGK